MATIDYTNPLSITVDNNTGLLLMVDDTGKRLARAETPAGLMSLAKAKGVSVGDLPPAVDPREGTNPKDDVTSAEASSDSAAEEPLTDREVANVESADYPDEQRNPELGPENQNQSNFESAASAKEEQKQESVAVASKKVSIGKEKTDSKVRDNPLFAYADYTYSLSFHVIPPEKYNDLATRPGYIYKNNDKTVLIASAGRRDFVDFQRSARFNEDFFFENLVIKTVVGMNARSRSSNAVEINFTLIEPYGVTLINRLLFVTQDIGAKSWMQIPFMLQIDFFGNDTLGNLMSPIKNQTKYLPVKLIGCKVKVTSKGTEYQLQAVPFSHQAFSETTASTPAFLEVRAKTVGEFFSSTGSAGEADSITKVQSLVSQRVESSMRESAEQRKAEPTGTRAAETETQARALSKDGVSTSYIVGSYTSAMNSYQRQLKENKHRQFSEIYEFVFDPEMANSEIVVPAKTAAARTPMSTANSPGGIAAIRAQAGLPTSPINSGIETFTINAGTNIIEVINMVMRNSEYIRKQVKDPAVDPQTAADKTNKPIDWYRIIPVIQIQEFDTKLDKYSKKTTYYVKKYTYFNSKFRDVPTSQPDFYCKEYNYMYTGKNQSIINFDIDFDTMFYTAITADRAKIQESTVQNQAKQSETDNSAAAEKPVTVQNKVVVPVSGQADMVNAASPDSKGVLINDFSKSMLSSSRGDMINIKLKIIGDPELIKQDDVFFNPANNPDQRADVVVDPKSGSVIYDAGEVFALVQFRTPVDFNPASGLVEWGAFETSVFSGMYKIITVDNEFANGVFTQTLDMIRLFDQPTYDSLQGSKINASNNRAAEVKTVADSKSPPSESDDFTGVDAAVARQAAINDVEATEAAYTAAAVSNSSESPIDTAYDAVEQQKLLRQQLLAAPTIEFGNAVDLGLGGA